MQDENVMLQVTKIITTSHFLEFIKIFLAHISQNCCPLHRDYMLLPHYKNIPLIKQFICEFTGNPVAPLRSGLCLQATLEIDWALRKYYL